MIDPGQGGSNGLGLVDRVLFQLRAYGKDPITAVVDGITWWLRDWVAAHPGDYWAG